MMTIPFKPNGQSPFTFQATVGGIKVFGKVPYNLYANRYYVNLTDGQGRGSVMCQWLHRPMILTSIWRCLAHPVRWSFGPAANSSRLPDALLPSRNHG